MFQSAIEWQELFPFTSHAPFGVTSGREKEFVCGATTSQLSLSSILSTPNLPWVMDLVRAITLQTLSFNATHIPGLKISIVDSLSRFQMDRFHSLGPLASPTRCFIPQSAMII